MPFFKPANIKLECVSLQASQSAYDKKINKRKRVYLFTSEGSITIEASIAIYIFIMILLFVESYLMFINTEFAMQRKINNVVIETSKNMFYAMALDEIAEENETAKEIRDKILGDISTEKGKYFLEKGIKKNYLTARLIQEIDLKNTKYFLCQVAGINTTESSIENGIVDLVATYKMEVPFVNKYITFTQRGKMKSWEGVDLLQNQDMIYITTHGQVYHTTKDCTYLSIRIRKVTYGECKETYNKCQICVNFVPSLMENVFITEEGNKYHFSLKCRGLVRNIITVSKKDIKNMQECSKCGRGK